MTTKATRNAQDTTSAGTLFVSFELSDKNWKLGFTTGHGQKPRERTVTARDQQRVLDEIAQAKRRLGLPETAPVVSCYEAGREGFWLHRFLEAHGMTNHVVDSSAIEVSRRQRRAKSDGLDVRKLLSMLIRYHEGERQVWQVVNVPSVEAEDQRHLHRDLETLKRERASTTARIKGLLSSQGIQGDEPDAGCPSNSMPCGCGMAHRFRPVCASGCCGSMPRTRFSVRRLRRWKQSASPSCRPQPTRGSRRCAS